MQIFLISSFEETAHILDYRRLGKQRVEAKQIIETLYKLNSGLSKIAWSKHPAVLMWEGYTKSLAKYGMILCKEWTSRGYKDSLFPWFYENYINDQTEERLPKWFGDERVFLSHKSNLIRKFPEYYRKFWPYLPDNLPYYWPVSC